MGGWSRDLTSARWLAIKGTLFIVLGVLASGVVIGGVAVDPEARPPAAVLIGAHLLSVWAFCRAYYFAFHVIEKYAGGMRYAGIGAAIRTCVRMMWRGRAE